MNDNTESVTTWINNSDQEVSLKLMQDRSGHAPFSVSFKNIVIKPGQSVKLSSQFDDAIQSKDKLGKIVGGLCPWLTKETDTDVNMEACLDYKAVESNLELEKLATKIAKDKNLEEAVKVQSEMKTKRVGMPKGGWPKKIPNAEVK